MTDHAELNRMIGQLHESRLSMEEAQEKYEQMRKELALAAMQLHRHASGITTVVEQLRSILTGLDAYGNEITRL